MKASEFFFKVCATCVVLVIAFSIAGWIGLREVWPIVAVIGVFASIALVIGIIASIWE